MHPKRRISAICGRIAIRGNPETELQVAQDAVVVLRSSRIYPSVYAHSARSGAGGSSKERRDNRTVKPAQFALGRLLKMFRFADCLAEIFRAVRLAVLPDHIFSFALWEIDGFSLTPKLRVS
ncbi:MAG: hypothetical protein ACP5E2_01455 [Terracidiphilus sp.]